MNSRKSSIFRIAVLSGMALLLVTVGILQYQWATQLSAATEVRLGSNLQSLMTSWHRDFYDELSAICIGLQVGPDSGAHDGWNDYLQRYAAWKREGANNQFAEGVYADPAVVREIYLWRTSVPERPGLLRLDPDYKVLAPTKQPPELQTLLARLAANSANLRMATRAWALRNESQNEQATSNNRVFTAALRRNPLAGWQLDETIPALVHPVVHHSNPFNSQTPVDRAAVDWLVVVLDFNIIQSRILPELAKRHFGGRDGLDYRLAVLATGDNPRLIYSSGPAAPSVESTAGFDSVMNIFGASSTNGQVQVSEASKRGLGLQDGDWRNFTASVWFPVIQYSSQGNPWILILSHRTGPVANIARNVLYRDLGIGGIVLLLLAANMGLVFFSSLRAQKLAKLQLDFVAAVSHEFLSPLSAMYCTGQNAKDGLVQTKAEVKTHGSIITSQARQLIDLVKQNLLFAATERGTKRYTLHPLKVSEIVRNVRKDLALLIEENGANIDCQIQEGLPNVMGDLSALTQCLQNLIVNAVKYSGRNCWIGISASLHDTKNDTREIQISVQDHGPGMSGSELRHIFEPFYRSPRVVEAQIHGTGLGLTVADRMAKAMGGSLSAMSEVGVGSTFVLHLPVQSAGVEVSADLKEAIWGQK